MISQNAPDMINTLRSSLARVFSAVLFCAFSSAFLTARTSATLPTDKSLKVELLLLKGKVVAGAGRGRCAAFAGAT